MATISSVQGARPSAESAAAGLAPSCLPSHLGVYKLRATQTQSLHPTQIGRGRAGVSIQAQSLAAVARVCSKTSIRQLFTRQQNKTECTRYLSTKRTTLSTKQTRTLVCDSLMRPSSRNGSFANAPIIWPPLPGEILLLRLAPSPWLCGFYTGPAAARLHLLPGPAPRAPRCWLPYIDALHY